MKKSIGIALIASALIALAGCSTGGSNNPQGSSNPVASSQEAASYTVTFETNGGTAVASVIVKENETLAEPSATTKTDNIFTGWFLEAALVTKAAFPLAITKNTTLYSGWKENRAYYLEARDKTVGASTKGFEYSSNLEMSVGYSSIAYSAKGTYEGKSQYNPGSTTSYYEKIAYAGLLFDNHTNHEYLKNNSLVSIKVQYDGKVTSYKSENQEAGYKYDSSSFAKALFSYTADDIKTVSLGADGKYEIKSKLGFSSIAKTILNNVNNKYVAMIVGELPETESTYHNYVTFSDDETIKTYSYSFTVTVSGVTVALSYSLDFSKADAAPAITIPTFSGLYLTESEITAKLQGAQTALSNYRSQATSAYDFTLKTGINFASANDIGATIKGSSKRAVSAGDVYFRNSIEVDSDLKNSDLYKDNGAEDYSRIRAKLADKTIYDVKDPLVGFKTYTEVTTDEGYDDFYLLFPNSIMAYANLSCLFDATKDGVETLTLPLSTNSSIASLMELINKSVRLDPSLAKHVNVLGEYQAASIVSDTSAIEIDLTGTALTEIRLTLKGKMTTSYAGSVGFTAAEEASYSVALTITPTNDGASYTAPTDKKDI